MNKLRQTLATSLIGLELLFSSGCGCIAPGITEIDGLNYAIERWFGDNNKDDLPPIEKRLASVPYTTDDKGNVTFHETRETYRASRERLVPYKGEWIPWSEKDKIQRGRLAELEEQLRCSDFDLSSLQRKILERLHEYESRIDNLDEFERILEELEAEIIKPTLEAKLKHENARKKYENYQVRRE